MYCFPPVSTRATEKREGKRGKEEGGRGRKKREGGRRRGRKEKGERKFKIAKLYGFAPNLTNSERAKRAPGSKSKDTKRCTGNASCLSQKISKIAS